MKSYLKALAGAAVLTLVSANAMAANVVTAKLETPVEKLTKPLAGGAVFVCQESTCVAGNPGSNTLSTSGCRQLVRAVGAVSSYGHETRSLDAEKLAACNASAKK
jgi:hypothetical protein